MHPGLLLASPLSLPGRHPALACGVLCSTSGLWRDEGGDTKDQATTASREGSSVWLENLCICSGTQRADLDLGKQSPCSQGCCAKSQGLVPVRGFPGGSAAKNPPANAGDASSVPGSGRSSRGGHCNPLQYSCLGKPMDRGVCRATVHTVTKSWTQLDYTTTANACEGLSTAPSTQAAPWKC